MMGIASIPQESEVSDTSVKEGSKRRVREGKERETGGEGEKKRRET